MAQITHDTPGLGTDLVRARRARAGLAFALVSAATFGLSGGLARGSLEEGWSPGALVLVRVGLGALLLLPLGLRALHGHGHLVRGNLGRIAAFGFLGVMVAQFSFFSAVQTMQVGPALLIEYTAPAAIVVWLWLRHGERPSRTTLAGAAVAAVGLVLVLDLVSGADLSLPGVLWALAAMVGVSGYFLLSAESGTALPPIALATGGLLAGSVGLGLLGLTGLMPMRATTADVVLVEQVVRWWVPLALLGVFTAAVSYATGVAATRRLGSRLASFVALLEVVAGVGFAWLLLGELPATIQLLGGVLVLVGVVTVKVGEGRAATTPGGGGYRGGRGDDDAFDARTDGTLGPAAA